MRNIHTDDYDRIRRNDSFVTNGSSQTTSGEARDEADSLTTFDTVETNSNERLETTAQEYSQPDILIYNYPRAVAISPMLTASTSNWSEQTETHHCDHDRRRKDNGTSFHLNNISMVHNEAYDATSQSPVTGGEPTFLRGNHQVEAKGWSSCKLSHLIKKPVFQMYPLRNVASQQDVINHQSTSHSRRQSDISLQPNRAYDIGSNHKLNV